MASSPSAVAPFTRYLDELVDALRRRVGPALREWDVEAIHRSRVATRRLKAAMDLLEPVLSDGGRREFSRVLRKLRRRLGPMRDVDVMLDHLGALARNQRHRAAAHWLMDRLRVEQARLRQKSLGAAPAPKVLGKLGAWWGIREQVEAAGAAVGGLLAASVQSQLEAFALRAAPAEGTPAVGNSSPAVGNSSGVPEADASALEADAPAVGEMQDPHALRIAGKALRYTLEMAQEHGEELPAMVARSFKKMQDALGLWHDHVVLSERMLRISADALLAHHDAGMQGAILDLCRLTLRRSEQHLGDFSRLWLERGGELRAVIAAAFVLEAAAAARGGGTIGEAAGGASRRRRRWSRRPPAAVTARARQRGGRTRPGDRQGKTRPRRAFNRNWPWIHRNLHPRLRRRLHSRLRPQLPPSPSPWSATCCSPRRSALPPRRCRRR
jgi:CHAD domain-containing protein